MTLVLRLWPLLLLPFVGLSSACQGAPAGSHAPERFDDDGERAAMARAFVDAHDAVRAGAVPAPDPPLPPVAWDEALEATAQAWANGCVFEHSGNAFGENLALFSSTDSAPADVVDVWAQEADDYDYDSNRCAAGRQCGHYTQIVWRDSTTIGCGVAECADVPGFGAGLLWVCNYDPPGNVVGERPY